MNVMFKTFEQLTTKEFYEILRLRSEVFVVEQTCIYNDLDGNDLEAVHMVLIEKEEIVGYLRILNPYVSFDTYSIGRVIINPKYRNRGLSKILLQQGINFVKNELGHSSIKINAESYLQKMYGSFGFVAFGEEFIEDGILHIPMKLNLDKKS